MLQKARPSHLTMVYVVNKVSLKDLPPKTVKTKSFEGRKDTDPETQQQSLVFRGAA